jgi:phosphotransferase system HPr (HPr) family protein
VTVQPIVDGEPTGSADGKSILSVLALGIKSGQLVRVTVEGEDIDVLVAELKEILANPEG